MSLTRLVLKRPTLAFVFVVTMILGGIVAARGLVIQAQPNANLPTVNMYINYNGGPVTYIRDDIVVPIEDQIAGSPGLQHIDSTINLGRAEITSTFALGTDQNADLNYVQRALQQAQSQLPTDLVQPVLRISNPAEGSVVSLALSSKKYSQERIAQIGNTDIAPAIEEIPGVADAEVRGLPQAAFEVTVDPTLLNAAGLTLTDIVNTIQANNVRAPGGLIYGRTETQIDVRGDLPDVASILGLPLHVTPGLPGLTNVPGETVSGVGTGSSSSASSDASGESSGATGSGSSGGGGSSGSGSSGGSSGGSIGSGGGSTGGTSGTAGSMSAPGVTYSGGTRGGGPTRLVPSVPTPAAGIIANATAVPSPHPGATYPSQSTQIAQAVPQQGALPTPSPGQNFSQSGNTSSRNPTVGGGASSSGAASSTASTTAGSTGVGATGTGAGSAGTGTGAASGASAGGGTSGGGASGGGASSTSANAVPSPGSATTNGQGGGAYTNAVSPVANVTAASPAPEASAGPGGAASSALGGRSYSVPTAPTVSMPSSPLGTSSALSTQSTVGAFDPYHIGSPNRKLGDVANVVYGAEPLRVFALLNGKVGVGMDVLKYDSASELTVADNVQKELPRLAKQFPDIQLKVDHVQAQFSKEQVDGVVRTLEQAIVFVAIVMLFFLRSWRNAVVVCVSIPTSLAVTLIVMNALHLTLDVISLLGMSLVIGTLVDDSTVVLENSERHLEDGEAPADAALRGRTEIGTAAVVITLVDVVIFLPVAFLGGPVGKQLSEFGIVVSVATLTSLFVSFTVTPALAGLWSLKSKWKPWPIIRWFNDRFERLRNYYSERILPAAERVAVLLIGVTVVLIVAAIALIPLGVVGEDYIPPGDQGEIFAQIFFPNGTALDETRRRIEPLDRELNKRTDLLSVETAMGGFQTSENIFASAGNAAQLHIFTKDPLKATEIANDVRATARKMVKHAKIIVFSSQEQGGGARQPIDYTISHQDSTDPTHDSLRLEREMKQVKGAIDVQNPADQVSPQVQVSFNRDLARTLDVPIGAASTAIRAAFGGATASSITLKDGLVQIDVIYPRSRQLSLDEIDRVPIRTNGGAIVHVGDIAIIKWEPTPSVLSREDRADVGHVSANVAAGAELSNVVRDFEARVKKLKLDSNVVVKPAGQSNAQLMRETLTVLGTSLAGSIVLVYLLMVALYDSYRTPFVILFAIPPATIGAIASLAITHQTLNLYSLIGTILLVGLVVKNSILLVDYADTLRERDGMDRDEAIKESAKTRFRPILMTTVALIAGMIPVALGLDPGGTVRKSLGIVVIGGLLSSLALTLVLVPIFYRWIAPKELKKPVELEDDKDRDDAKRDGGKGGKGADDDRRDPPPQGAAQPA